MPGLGADPERPGRSDNGAHRRRPAQLGRPKAIESVDYERFGARFSRVLDLRPTDFNRYPVFAFTFVEVPSSDLSELHAVLGCDLREYLRMR